jgi:two-component system cell cycle sensor histidine kinase/response regulator CckA
MAKKSAAGGKFRTSIDSTRNIKKTLSAYRFHIIMVLVTVAILAGGYWFYHDQEQQMRRRIEGGLLIVAQLKAEQITEWRNERLGDANILVGSPFFTEGVQKYLSSPTDTEARDKVLSRLAIIENTYPYQDILLTDTNGKVLLSLNGSVNRLSDMTLSQVSTALKEHKAVFTDFQYHPDSTSPHLDVVAPLFPWRQNSQPAIGAVVLCIDPSRYLYPLLQSSPTPSQTAETLLVERDGDQVLFLNELRHQKDTALKLKIPLSQQEVPAVMAVLGKEGIVEGKDYRGVEVLAALQHIPDSPWYIVTKIDTSEALLAWRARSGFIIAFFAGLLAAALAVIGLIWQRRQRLAYQALYKAELESQALRSHFDYLVKYAHDIILLVDEKQHIVEANDRALEAYGYAREEMLGMPLATIIPPGDLSSFQARIHKIKQKGKILAETIHQRKDGTTFPVEVSGQSIKIEDKTYLQGIIRDITERKAREEEYRAIIGTTIDGFWQADMKGHFSDVNEAYCHLTGYNREELLNMSITDVEAIENPEETARRIQKIKEVGHDRFESRHRCKDGQVIDVEISVNYLPTDGGRLFVFIRDITERKRAEEILRESEGRFRSIFDNNADAMFLTIPDGRIIAANPAARRMFGYTEEEFRQYGRNAILDANDPRLKTALGQRRRTGIFKGELAFKRKDGTSFPGEISSVVFKDRDGQDRTSMVVRDLTERKQAEEALRQSEERYRTILEQMDESYYEVDLAGNLTFVNDALCRRLGHTREELIGMNYRAYTPKDRIDNTFKTFNQVFRTGQPVIGYPAAAIASDGSMRFVERSIFPLRDGEGKIIGFRGISHDVTERVRAEEDRKQLELKAQITGRLASVGEMTAGVAHEINNPLTAVTGYAQLLMDREDIPPDIRNDLAAINDGARRVAGIVQRLLAFSRQTKPERKLVDINELIESTLVLRAYHLRVNNIEIVTRLAHDLLETVVDPGQIQQVLLNLIVNAETEMKLAHGKGKLTITTEKINNTITISVKDDGPGIKPEVMDRIFDPFFTTRETGQGTGLGLSLCYGIVTGHNGKIYAESKPGKGATFIFELPVIIKPKPLKPPEKVIEKSQKVGKARILVVDDEQVVRDVVNRVLTAEGHKVETAGNANDAMKKIESKRYDLILADIKMPGINGVELYKRIQKINKSLARKVVFITGDIMGADTEKFLSETKVAHIEKPFDAERLKKKVMNALTNVDRR